QTIFYPAATSSTILEMAPNATANPLIIRNSSGTTIFAVSPSGVITTGTIPWGSVTGTPNFIHSVSERAGIKVHDDNKGSIEIENTDRGSSQHIFKQIRNSSNTTQFSASSNNDYLQFDAGGILSVAFNSSNRRITYSASLTAGSNIRMAGRTISTMMNPSITQSVSNPLLRHAVKLTLDLTC